MKRGYPYTGEAARFRDCIHGMMNAGVRYEVDTSTGELVIFSPDPIPPTLAREIRHFKRSLVWFVVGDRTFPPPQVLRTNKPFPTQGTVHVI